MKRKALFVPIVVAMSLGFAACGDDDKPLSKSELIKKANAICKDTQAKGAKVKLPADLETNPQAAADFFEEALPIAENQTKKFEELKPADDVKADWDQLVARQKQEEGLIKTLLEKSKAKDRSGLVDLAKLRRVDAKFVTEAAAVGADTCASG